MRITPDILKKYHQGQCSPLEKMAVEIWLSAPEEKEIMPFPHGETEREIKEIMWGDIAAFMTVEKSIPQAKPYGIRQFLSYAAAACLLMAFLAFGGYKWTMTDTGTIIASMDNRAGSTNRQLISKGLTITLTPKSKAETATDWAQKSGSVNFCGNILITNNSDEDIELRFNTSCQRPSQKILKCEKGRTYVAIHYKFNDEEILVFDKSDLATTLLPIQVYSQLERI